MWPASRCRWRAPWHLRRWLAGLIALAVAGRLVWAIVANPRPDWHEVGRYLFADKILEGVLVTLQISVPATVIGLSLGVLLAVMRLADNPVLQWLATLYIWFFRGTPLLVQLIFWYNLAFLFPDLVLRVPFTGIGMKWDTNELMTGFTAAMLGLGLNLGGVLRRDGPRRHPGGRPRTDRSGLRPGHDAHEKDADHRAAPGAADHHPADRQRVHLDAQDHVTGLRRGGQRPDDQRQPDLQEQLPDHGAPDRGEPVVHADDLRRHPRPVVA
ncbi:ABC transporter permease subunit [Nocardioides sp. B-3]|nr:ABC transporter permease subunit [Nocardioides sp. B-3]UUZ59705.1 ABC transporter permease subunit [Nocardioides sp. B-3]